MNQDERSSFNAIVAGFEANYVLVRKEQSLPDDLVIRTAFYQSCLDIARDGPRLRSAKVQAELVKHYAKLRDETFEEISSRVRRP